MEAVDAVENNRQVFRLMNDTGIRKSGNGETFQNDEFVLHSQFRRLDR